MSSKQPQTASAPLPHPSKGLLLVAAYWMVLAAFGSLMAHTLG
jgi:hypothetical protein